MRSLKATPLLLLAGLIAGSSVSAGEWQILFDGSSAGAWRSLKHPAEAPLVWMVEDGALAWRKGAGHIISREAFGDFELELDWRIFPAGNSGIMFRVDETSKQPWQSGPEIQLLDNMGHRNGRNPLTTSGALYRLYPPLQAADRSIGEWNRLRLRVVGSRLQTWMNGTLIQDCDMNGADWKARVAKSKFARFAGFGRSATGRIVLQDHGNPVWFRNVRIRELPP